MQGINPMKEQVERLHAMYTKGIISQEEAFVKLLDITAKRLGEIDVFPPDGQPADERVQSKEVLDLANEHKAALAMFDFTY